MKTDKFIEAMAAVEHEQWMAWAGSIMSTEDITPKRKERWEKLMVPYDQLSEEMKEHDRKWARKALAAYFLAHDGTEVTNDQHA